MKKLRMHSKVIKLLEDFGPDIILFHGLCGWELLSVAAYKKAHPNVKIYADSHEDPNNSGRNFFSKILLHKIYYRTILKIALPYISKILCVSLETMDFVKTTYGIPDSTLEFFPLGGIIYSDKTYNEKRSKLRYGLGISDNDVVVVQAGKMGKKKKVIESIHAFKANKRENLRLLLIGSLDHEIQDEVHSLVNTDKNILFLGWMNSAELMDYLCAADVYLQPGSQSAILQNALCLRCAVILADVPSHKPFIHGNGWLLNKNLSLSYVFDCISQNPEKLRNMTEASFAVAKQMLDYSKLAARLYN